LDEDAVEHLYHFNLNQDPFQNEPDLRFYFESETHRRAQLRMDRALRQSKGLVVLTGEGGTGKSVLARRLFEGLEEEIFESALMVMMQGSADATSVLRRFAAELGVEAPPTERSELIGVLYEQLAIVREDGRHVVLILDDAHVLGQQAMAEIGGLMNFEYEDRRLLSLVLVGLPELDTMISGIPSLGERVDVRVPLRSLGEADAAAYIAHRIQAAGGDAAIMDEAATQTVFKLGGGRPRRMNALADNALFEAYLGGRTIVSAADVESAGRDLALDSSPDTIAVSQLVSESASGPAPETPVLATPGPMIATESDAETSESVLSMLDSTAGPSLEEVEFEPTLASMDEFEMAESSLSMAADGEPELQLADPIEPFEASEEDSAPAIAAAADDETTTIALADDCDAADGFASPPSIDRGEAISADEIDDLFVDLLED